MTYRLVALDIDGTIVGPDLVLSPRLRRAVAMAQDNGATVMLATGRMLRSARRFADELQTNGPVVCYQGAVTADSTGNVTRHERLDRDTARDVISALKATDAHVNVYVDDEIYVDAAGEWATGYAYRMRLELKLVDDLMAMAGAGPTLVMAVDEPSRTEALAARLTLEFCERALVTHSTPTFCEIASPSAGKMTALQAVLSGLGMERSQVVAFGDGAGDAEMLRWAGLGVAVGEAHPHTVAAADLHVKGPEDDGVALALEGMLDAGMLGG